MFATTQLEPHVELVMDVFKTQSIELAIDVFKGKSKALVKSLKDFFTGLPTPKCVEEVLIEAIYQLAETDPDACRWLLRHPDYLEPELDLVGLATQLARTSLENQGFALGQDFYFEPNGKLYISEQVKARLKVGDCAGERLLVEEILKVNTL